MPRDWVNVSRLVSRRNWAAIFEPLLFVESVNQTEQRVEEIDEMTVARERIRMLIAVVFIIFYVLSYLRALYETF